MPKTLDVVAEQAFVEHLTLDEVMRLPEVLPHARYRAAWQAAAEAVAAKIGNRELQAKSLAELDAEYAVIEAVGRMDGDAYAELDTPLPLSERVLLREIVKRYRALQEAE